MKYYGTVIDLENYFGPITLHNNTFSSNVLKYQSCDVAT